MKDNNVGVNKLALLQTLSVDKNTPGKSNGPLASRLYIQEHLSAVV